MISSGAAERLIVLAQEEFQSTLNPALWILASVGEIIFLVPLNSHIAAGNANSQRIYRVWDRGHRVRTAVLAIAAMLLTCVLVY